MARAKKCQLLIIQPNFEFIKDWIERKNKDIGTTEAEIAASQIIIERIQKEINSCNMNFGNWEQIKRFELTPEAWTIDGGHLTPTMKMKRAVIKTIYTNLIEKIYRP